MFSRCFRVFPTIAVFRHRGRRVAAKARHCSGSGRGAEVRTVLLGRPGRSDRIGGQGGAPRRFNGLWAAEDSAPTSTNQMILVKSGSNG
ncbi:unnamed protein product [Boreogadus saida]